MFRPFIEILFKHCDVFSANLNAIAIFRDVTENCLSSEGRISRVTPHFLNLCMRALKSDGFNIFRVVPLPSLFILGNYKREI